jgi:flagellar motor protein MotB
LAQNLVIDNTPEGLRIQLVDQEKASMFPSGGATMNDNLKKILEKVADIVHRMPNQIAISGHTDSVQFRGRKTRPCPQTGASRLFCCVKPRWCRPHRPVRQTDTKV